MFFPYQNIFFQQKKTFINQLINCVIAENLKFTSHIRTLRLLPFEVLEYWLDEKRIHVAKKNKLTQVFFRIRAQIILKVRRFFS